MRSLGGEVVKKAMWLYPKVLGFNPSERWGHSACCFNGVVYIFGGCCGGLHFSDVLTLNLDTMAWNTLLTTGQRPGARDSHSAVLVRHKMIVLGGTNGSKKVNDLHILDLRTKEWSNPICEGTPPSPRESHSATVVGDDKLVIFGGSGEGEANYLNDLHVLDLNTMRWTSPEVKGDLPAPRDSHIAVAIGNKILIYGGDCGDRYHGEVDVLDMDTFTWSRLVVQGLSPGVRAGHAAVNIGTKVYIIGGVGDKHYYNDVWVLDISTCSWTQLVIRGQQPQGRFSHTAVVTGSDIAIYGGCGEDERPLNELLILQLGAEHPNGRYNISLCKIFGNHWNQERKRFHVGAETNLVFGISGEVNRKVIEPDSKHSRQDNLHQKRRKTSDSKAWEIESEQEEHSLSLSQHSSPSQSDQEQAPTQNLSTSVIESIVTPRPFGSLKHRNHVSSNCHPNNIASNQLDLRSTIQRTPHDFQLVGGDQHPRQPKPERSLHACTGRQEVQYVVAAAAAEHKPSETGPIHNLIGAEIRGKVDGAFDSGYLMTANVNGKILRGVLFNPGPGIVPRVSVLPQNPSIVPARVAGVQQCTTSNCIGPPYVVTSQQPMAFTKLESTHNLRQGQSSLVVRAAPTLTRADLQDTLLTLGGPGSGHGGS